MIEKVLDYNFNRYGKFVLHGINERGQHEVNFHDPSNGRVLESRIYISERDLAKAKRLDRIMNGVLYGTAVSGLALAALSIADNNIPYVTGELSNIERLAALHLLVLTPIILILYHTLSLTQKKQYTRISDTLYQNNLNEV